VPGSLDEPMAPGGFRTFGTTWIGRIVLVLIGIFAVAGALFYLGALVTILAMLVCGAFLPIYLGWKSTRQLALAGLVILLASAPVFSVAYASQLRVPSPSEGSNPSAPYGNGQAVVQNATVTPYTGAAGGTYTFSASIEPQNLPPRSTLHYLLLIVTDCPDATGNRSPACPAGYPFYEQNHSFSATPAAPTTVSFQQRLSGVDVWWWTFDLAFNNSTSKNLTQDWLYSQGTYDFPEGPVSGSFGQTFAFILPASYEVILVYPGLVFFVALLIYAVLKRRQATRGAGAPTAGTPGAPPGTPPTAPPGAPGAPPSNAAANERRCPNCQAVVYPNESSCWKCGKSLAPPQPATAQPLSSGKAP
jgi:hypothetical protein